MSLRFEIQELIDLITRHLERLIAHPEPDIYSEWAMENGRFAVDWSLTEDARVTFQTGAMSLESMLTLKDKLEELVRQYDIF